MRLTAGEFANRAGLDRRLWRALEDAWMEHPELGRGQIKTVIERGGGDWDLGSVVITVHFATASRTLQQLLTPNSFKTQSASWILEVPKALAASMRSNVLVATGVRDEPRRVPTRANAEPATGIRAPPAIRKSSPGFQRGNLLPQRVKADPHSSPVAGVAPARVTPAFGFSIGDSLTAELKASLLPASSGQNDVPKVTTRPQAAGASTNTRTPSTPKRPVTPPTTPTPRLPWPLPSAARSGSPVPAMPQTAAARAQVRDQTHAPAALHSASERAPSLDREFTLAAVVFDLDGTLLSTTDLERFRGKDNLGRNDEEYRKELIKAARLIPPDRRKPSWFEAAELERRGVPMAVLSRAPATYVRTLLNEYYPSIKWLGVLGFEDVARTKPHPDGLDRLRSLAKIVNPSRAYYVGDEITDIDTAYAAGWRAAYTGPKSGKENGGWRAMERYPDALINTAEDFRAFCGAPQLSLPLCEWALEFGPRADAIEESTATIPDRVQVRTHQYFVHHDRDTQEPWVMFDVSCLGRYFRGAGNGHARLHQRHALTRELLRAKDSGAFDERLTVALAARLARYVAAHSSTIPLVVTVIPAKSGRKARMESLLEAISRRAPFRRTNGPSVGQVRFDADVFAFRPEARSNHGNALTAEQRENEAQDNLYVRNGRSIEGAHVVVIDDIVTSGSTLYYASKFAMQAGATSTRKLAIARSI